MNTTDTEEIIRTIKAISPIFGGINLEDIGSPRCFEIEAKLAEQLDIPVFHDDQHGTVPIDVEGAIVRGSSYSQTMWQWLADQPEVGNQQGSLKELIADADVFIGVSRGGLLSADDIKRMAPQSIVFAMANPNPEITPEEALPYVKVYATGRSDYPNQINNVLVFPGIFRGALDCQAKTINESMKLAAARAIAAVVSKSELNEQYIIPSIFNEQVVTKVRHAVIEAVIITGVARRTPPEFR